MIVWLTKVFCDKHYLSEINILKEVDPKGLREYNGKDRRIKPWGVLEPLARCPKCTLRPPCCHISEQVGLPLNASKRLLESNSNNA